MFFVFLCLSCPSKRFLLLIQVKHFLQLDHAFIGMGAAKTLEIGGHEVLPALVDLLLRHAFECVLEAEGRLEVAEEQAVVAHEERVVVPAGAGEGIQHLRPDRFVVFDVFGDLVLFDFEKEGDAFHG